MNEVQRINALNEWFLDECRKKSSRFVHEAVEAVNEWDELTGHLPMFGAWLQQRMAEKWIQWAIKN